MSILIHLQDPAGGFWTEQAGGAGQWIRGGQNRGPGHGAATLHIKNIKVSWFYMSWDRFNSIQKNFISLFQQHFLSPHRHRDFLNFFLVASRDDI